MQTQLMTSGGRLEISRSKMNQVLVYLGFFIFFLFNLTSNFSASHDSIDYLYEFENGLNLIQPHHLFYHFTTYGFLQLLKLVFPHVQAYLLVEVITALWSSASMVVIFRIMKDCFRVSNLHSIITCCLVAFSFGYWFYSTNIEVYMPPLFFLLLCLRLLSKPGFKKQDITWLIVFHAMAILFHQVNILFTPILIWKFWKERKQVNPFFNSMVKYVVAGAVVILAYFVSGWYILGNQSQEKFMNWIEGYTNSPLYWFPLSLSTLFNAIVGLSHAFIGGEFMFRIHFIQDFLNKKFFYHNLTDELYLVRNLSPQIAEILLMLSLLLLVMMIATLILILRKWKTIAKDRNLQLTPFLLFLLIYSIFFFFWMPENLEFWIPQSVVIWILLSGLSPYIQIKIKPTILLSTMAVLLFTINYWGSMKWLKNIDNDFFYAKTLKVCKEATANDIIILEDPWLTESYLKRSASAPVLLVPEKSKPDERKAVDEAITHCLGRGGKIYLFQETTFMHAIKNNEFTDSLFKANSTRISDMNEPLTPIKIIQ